MTDAGNRGVGKTPPAAYALVAVLSAAVGFGAVYAIVAAPDKSALPAGSKPPVLAASSSPVGGPVSKPAAGAGNPLATGEMLTFVYAKSPETLPAIAFEDGEGRPRTLADFTGKVVLLNLWATWCAPCRKEMPGLDRLQAAAGGPGFEVVALSVDRQGASAARKFLDETQVRNLKLYVDSSSRSLGQLKVTGLPTTILIGRQGQEIGRLAGPAEWDSPDARRLIDAALK